MRVISPCPRNLFFQRHDLGVAHALALSCHVAMPALSCSVAKAWRAEEGTY
jgi:hypothetical protein